MTARQLLEGTKNRIETKGWAKGLGKGPEGPLCILLSLTSVWETLVKREIVRAEYCFVEIAWNNAQCKKNLATSFIAQSIQEGEGKLTPISKWNDKESTTKEMILEVLDKAIDKCDVSLISSVTL